MSERVAVTAEPPSNARVSRREWLEAARRILIEKGVDHVRILTLSRSLRVSRSSFYWQFKDRADLLEQLVDLWRTANTVQIVRQAERSSSDIVEGVLNVFACWTAASPFDPRLDFAMREWSRRDVALHRVVLAADAACVDAIASLFRLHGYEDKDAFVRSRVMYFTQIGYYALELGESEQQRLQYTSDYVHNFTGVLPKPEQMAPYRDRVLSAAQSSP